MPIEDRRPACNAMRSIAGRLPNGGNIGYGAEPEKTADRRLKTPEEKLAVIIGGTRRPGALKKRARRAAAKFYEAGKRRYKRIGSQNQRYTGIGSQTCPPWWKRRYTGGSSSL